MKHLFFALVLILPLRQLHALQESGVGGRDAGLGGAMTALGDDAYSLYYNPAGLPFLNKSNLSASYGFLNSGPKGLSNASDWSVSAAVPFGKRIGAFGLSWRQVYEEGLYREQAAALGAGHQMLERCSVGVVLRYLRHEYDASETFQ